MKLLFLVFTSLFTVCLSKGLSIEDNEDGRDLKMSISMIQEANAKTPEKMERWLTKVGENICDRGGRITRLSLVYENTAATSSYQGSKATCVEADYPTSATLTINGLMKMEVSLLYLIEFAGFITDKTVFDISGWGKCHIDTSCTVPLVIGDKLGPFLVLDGDTSGVSPTRTPIRKPTKIPARRPTRVPTIKGPTRTPIRNPTKIPARRPTRVPTIKGPTHTPIRKPTKIPARRPTRVPTIRRPTQVPVVPPLGKNICKGRGNLISLTLQYDLPSATSKVQGDKSTCVKSNYPAKGTLNYYGTEIPFDSGTRIVVGGGPTMRDKTEFEISNWGKCYIDTSCSVPVRVGDKIGPFLVLSGDSR